jgi:uncharacterized Tic20 family protein
MENPYENQQSPPPPPPQEPVVDVNADGQTSTSDERMIAMFAHILGILGTGFIGPLIIYLVKKNESRFIAEHARHALNFQITVTIAIFVCVPLVYVCIGLPMAMAVGVCDLIFSILAALAANKGEAYRYPVTIPFVRG